MSPIPFSEQRKILIERYVQAAGVTDKRVLKAMRVVPRHDFVSEQYRENAYEDHPLPIGSDQTISQPSLVALMTQLLKLTGSETVLEIGTGSGYQTAILSLLAKEVISIERIKILADQARNTLKKLGYSNITILYRDGSKGYVKKSPYDAIVVTAAAKKIPPALVKQLKEKGRMVIPVNVKNGQMLRAGTKQNGNMHFTNVEQVSFVPMIEDTE